MKKAPLWKMAILIWLAVYPTITLIFFVFGKWISLINPLPLRTLSITLILVPLMVFVFTPVLTKVFYKWLQK